MNDWWTMRALRRSWWLMLMALAVGSASAWGVTVVATPRYEANVVFLLTPTGDRMGDLLQGGVYSRDRAKLYADLASADRLAKMLAFRDGIGLTSQQIQKRVTARRVDDTALIRVTVTDTRRGRVERLAGAIAEEFGKLVMAIETPPSHGSPLLKAEPVAGPTVNPRAVFPQPLRNLGIGLLTGLALGVLAVAVREVFDRTARTPDQVVMSAKAPVIATLPHRSRLRRNPIVVTDDYFPAAEPFRQLRTWLSHRDGSIPAQILVVTSPVSREGRSTTAVNLALAFTAAGKRVLLLEADWRNSRIAQYLGLTPGPGLSDVLAGRLTTTEAVHRVDQSTLWVLCAGASPRNPSELLDSPAMTALLCRERAAYDLIVIDTPAVLFTTDAVVVAGRADGVVLVGRAGRVTNEQIRDAAEMLRGVGARLLGCVLNDVPRWDGTAGHHAGHGSGSPPGAVVSPRISADTPHQPVHPTWAGTERAGAVTAQHALVHPTPDTGSPLGSAR